MTIDHRRKSQVVKHALEQQGPSWQGRVGRTLGVVLTFAISAVGGLQLLCVQHLFFGSENNVFSTARVCEKLFFVIEHKEIWITSLWSSLVKLSTSHDLTANGGVVWFSKGNPLISGKSRLVKYYNLARSVYFSHTTTYTIGHSM